MCEYIIYNFRQKDLIHYLEAWVPVTSTHSLPYVPTNSQFAWRRNALSVASLLRFAWKMQLGVLNFRGFALCLGGEEWEVVTLPLQYIISISNKLIYFLLFEIKNKACTIFFKWTSIVVKYIKLILKLYFACGIQKFVTLSFFILWLWLSYDELYVCWIV